MKKIYVVMNDNYYPGPAFAMENKEDAIAFAAGICGGEEKADARIVEIPYIADTSSMFSIGEVSNDN